MHPYYDDGQITIYHGDCREIVPSLGSWQVLVTDPPFGIGFAAQPTKWQRLAGHEPEAWDNEAPDITALVSASMAACVWGGNYFALPKSRGWLAWVKPDAPPSMGSVELAWTSIDRTMKHIIWSISATNAERLGHPTQKPLAVMRWSIAGMPDGVILDPFMGSGTTLRAAKDLGRKAIGIEISEEYCEIAVKRLAQGVLM